MRKIKLKFDLSVCCGLAIFPRLPYHFSIRKTVFPHANYRFSIPSDQVPFFSLTLRNYFVVVFAAVAIVVLDGEERKEKISPFLYSSYSPFLELEAFPLFGFPKIVFPRNNFPSLKSFSPLLE